MIISITDPSRAPIPQRGPSTTPPPPPPRSRAGSTSDRMTRLEENIDARFAKLEADIDDRFATVDARFNKLAENQQEIALTLARLVALLEAGENQCAPRRVSGTASTRRDSRQLYSDSGGSEPLVDQIAVVGDPLGGQVGGALALALSRVGQ